MWDGKGIVHGMLRPAIAERQRDCVIALARADAFIHEDVYNAHALNRTYGERAYRYLPKLP